MSPQSQGHTWTAWPVPSVVGASQLRRGQRWGGGRGPPGEEWTSSGSSTRPRARLAGSPESASPRSPSIKWLQGTKVRVVKCQGALQVYGQVLATRCPPARRPAPPPGGSPYQLRLSAGTGQAPCDLTPCALCLSYRLGSSLTRRLCTAACPLHLPRLLPRTQPTGFPWCLPPAAVLGDSFPHCFVFSPTETAGSAWASCWSRSLVQPRTCSMSIR